MALEILLMFVLSLEEKEEEDEGWHRFWSFICCDTTHRGEAGQKVGVKHFHLGWKQQETIEDKQLGFICCDTSQRGEGGQKT